MNSRPDPTSLSDSLAAGALGILVLFAVLTDFAGAWAVHTWQAGIFGIGAAWCAATAATSGRFRFHPLLLPFLVIVLWGSVQLSAGWTIAAFETRREIVYWGSLTVIFALGLHLFISPRLRNGLLTGLPWLGAALAAAAILQSLTGTGRAFGLFETGYENEVFGPFVSRDHYSALAVLILPVAVHRALTENRHRLANAVLAGLIFSSVIVAASRAGFLLVTAEVVLLLSLGLFRKRSSRTAAARTLVVLAVLTAAVGGNALQLRLRAENPFELRRQLFASTVEMIRDSPWAGRGLGSWPLVYPQYATIDPGLFVNHAHNDWAEWWSDGGAPLAGALLVIAVAGAVLAVGCPWGIGVPALFLHSFVDYPMRKFGIAAILVMLLALMIVTRMENNRSSEGGSR